MKAKKMKRATKIKLDIAGWSTTDADEIELRRLRGQTEKFALKNIDPPHTYFSAFLVGSKQGKQYTVEIRSLVDPINSCNCPDYCSNCLGTCKHIEHVLFRLKKAGAKLFKQAQLEGSTQVEIFLDHRDATLRIYWPSKIKSEIRQVIDPFFSADGTLIGNPVSVYPALQKAIFEHQKVWKGFIRVSSHIDHFIEYQRQVSQKQAAKDLFLTDISQGKTTFEVTKYPLYPYQQEGMLHLAFTERALLADEMGLGKTVQAVAACELLSRRRKVARVLVVATASLKAEWAEQITKFTDLSYLIVQGSRADRLQQYQKTAFFYLTNYEQVIMDGPDIQRLLSPDVIILDEAQRIKNWQTKTANAVKQLKSRYAFVLTGTPLENRIDDIYSIVQFLDPHIFGPLFRFNRDFYELDEKGKPIGYKNLDELNRRLRPIMLRRRKSDVEGQLPKRTVNNYFVKMESEQLIRYEEYKDRVARLLAQAKRRPLRKEEFEKLQKWLACMRMICDTPYILDPKCRISPKLRELQTILEELLADKSAKIIIFSEWERMLHLVREWVAKKDLEAAWHTGSVPQHKRREDIQRFKEHPNCRIFLSTDSGSVGLNLQSANIVINLDLPWNPAKLEQRIARAWRKHQTRSVQVINLVCEDSIEHRMLGLLAQKQTLAQSVLEENSDLKAMKLPSGRAAFIERMENLMGPWSHSAASTNAPSANHYDVSFDRLRDRLEILQVHHHAETGQQTVLAVVDTPSDDIRKQLRQSLIDKTTNLEILDRAMFETLQRLAQAGILTLNYPTEVLHTSAAFSKSRRQLQEKQIAHAKKYCDQAARKQRMAQVLADSNFHEESFAALREALEATLYSFSWIVGKNKDDKKEILSHRFIQEQLIDQHKLPNKAVSLLMQLSNLKEGGHDANIKTLLTEHQAIFQHVKEKLNKLGVQ